MERRDIDLSETNGLSLVSTAAAFLALTWISVSLRTYTRAVLMKGFQVDDWIMLVAQVCSRLMTSASIVLPQLAR